MISNAFEEYVSLGDNCELGLNFFRIGHDYSSMFRFSMTPFNALLRVLNNNFVGLYDEIEPVANNMVRCQRYGISFHTKLHSEETAKGRRYLSDLDVNSIHADDILKLRYLENKFRLERSDGKRILYFVKSNNKISDDDLVGLKNCLDGFGKGSQIICLAEKCSPREVEDGIYIRPVDFFAPYKNAYSYCSKSWDLIFQEFPLADGKCNQHPIKPKIEL